MAIANLPGLAMEVRSRWFSSAAMPDAGQPRYVNGVVRLRGDVSPSQLLAELQNLERLAGRVRGAPNAARTLDLDIIDMNGLVRDAPDPVLPHPRAQHRAFVLLPLRDVAPAWVHPVTGAPIGQLIAQLPPQDLRPA
jgi:2-amino-4-hydroxy-6-hydroxymethyldihydropteridine diphosphokinase